MQSNPKKTDQINKETKISKCRITELKILLKINIFLLLIMTVKIFVLFLLLGILTIWPTVGKSISCFINYFVVIFIHYTAYTWYIIVCEMSYYVRLKCSPNSIAYCKPTHPKHFHFSYLYRPQRVKLGYAVFFQFGRLFVVKSADEQTL